MATGDSEFNEVFFDDVFVPDDDVVGPVDGGWTVARATLGNESVSIGGGRRRRWRCRSTRCIAPLDAHPERLPGGAGRVGRHIARSTRRWALLNLRSAHRAVAGGGPGPEGNVTKLRAVGERPRGRGDHGRAGRARRRLPRRRRRDRPAMLVLMHRAMSIAGGTSEIKRNQIGERILGLPRDPLIK